MADRRTAERLIVPPESLQRVSMGQTADPAEEQPEEPTQPMRLSFLALLADRDPAVQARLNLRRKLALEGELPKEDERPTDPMLELDDRGTVSQAFTADGAPFLGPPARQPRTRWSGHITLRTGSYADFAAACHTLGH